MIQQILGPNLFEWGDIALHKVSGQKGRITATSVVYGRIEHAYLLTEAGKTIVGDSVVGVDFDVVVDSKEA